MICCSLELLLYYIDIFVGFPGFIWSSWLSKLEVYCWFRMNYSIVISVAQQEAGSTRSQNLCSILWAFLCERITQHFQFCSVLVSQVINETQYLLYFFSRATVNLSSSLPCTCRWPCQNDICSCSDRFSQLFLHSTLLDSRDDVLTALCSILGYSIFIWFRLPVQHLF